MKTRSLNLLMIILLMATLVSCKDDKKETEANPAQSEVKTDANPKTTASVNPAHGLPGHRCDLPVGAPLDSSATNSQQATPTTPVSSSVSPIRVDQTPKVNPPHGEPGHDCSKPVGSPLQ